MAVPLTLAARVLASQSSELTADVQEVYIQLRFIPLFNVIKGAGSAVSMEISSLLQTTSIRSRGGA